MKDPEFRRRLYDRRKKLVHRFFFFLSCVTKWSTKNIIGLDNGRPFDALQQASTDILEKECFVKQSSVALLQWNDVSNAAFFQI